MCDEFAPISVTYECTRREQIHASKILSVTGASATRSASSSGILGWLAIVSIIMALIVIENPPGVSKSAVILPSLKHTMANVLGASAFLLGAIVFLAGCLLTATYIRQQRFRWKWPIVLSLGRDGVRMQRPGRSDEYSWAYFCGLDEGLDVFVLRTSARTGFTVPKRLFTNVADLQLVSAFIRKNIVSPASPGAPPASDVAMRIAFVHTAEDLAEAARVGRPRWTHPTAPNALTVTRVKNWSLSMVVTGTIVVLASALFMSLRQSPGWIIGVIAALVITKYAARVLYNRLTAATVRRWQHWLADDALANGVFIFAVDEAGFHLLGSTWKCHVDWGAVRGFFETPSLFVLWDDTQKGFIMPKRAFTTLQQREDFNRFVHAQLTRVGPGYFQGQSHPVA